VQILEYLAHVRPEAALADIAGDLGLNKSTCFNILKTLAQSSLVVRDPRFPIYRLGPKLVELGSASRRNYSYRALVKRHAEPVVERRGLACLVGQLLPRDAGIVVIDRILPPGKGVVTAAIGQVLPLSVPAMGRAVLATRPVDSILDLADVLGPHDDLDRFQRDLERIAREGYATSFEEYAEGVNAVATTVASPDGEVALVLCLLGGTATFPKDQVPDAGAELCEVAKQLEAELHHRSPVYQA
jgi:IclR family acetate operon transcriptional repressor